VPAEVWHRRVLVSDVHSLFDNLLFREEVLAALRKDPTLSEADREFVLQVAQTHGEVAWALNEARELKTAWKVVSARDGGKDNYALALRRAEAAVRRAPNGYPLIFSTLGIAQYRMGRHAEALDTLTKSESLNARWGGIQPSDLAFLAMAQHQVGKMDEAKATLGRLREVMKQPQWVNNTEAQGFLREADELIAGKPPGKKE